MTASSFDPVTGAPQFADSDAPDVAQNPTEVAEFAATVGTRLIGTTAARTAYTYAREGLEWYDTDIDSVYVHNGSGWVLWGRGWTSYTPTLTNMAGTATASYRVTAGAVQVRFRIVVTSVTGLPKFTLPLNASDTDVEFLAGQVMLTDVSLGQYYVGIVRRSAVGDCDVYSQSASGAYVQMALTSSSVPFTWASGDIITVNVSYRSA